MEGTINIRGVAVSLQIDGDHLTAFRELRQDGAKHIARAKSAVNQDQGLALLVDFVIHLQAVNFRIAGYKISFTHVEYV